MVARRCPWWLAWAALWVTGLAAMIVVLERRPAPYQFQGSWITNRSTAEALKHERYCYLARAGPCVGEDRHPQLAERIGLGVTRARKTTSHQQAAKAWARLKWARRN